MPDFEAVKPLTMAESLEGLRVGQPVAACGFPFGTEMMRKHGQAYRFGPVVQQGHISAISPYDGYTPTELLLDLRMAEGMSGSPVFLPGDGSVIGIHYEAWESITALAIPLHKSRVEVWLEEHDRARAERGAAPSPE
jgi:S1-C subfamily serine protease